ncbi:hypothetical protein SAMD00079811_20910 [Scytonema sp. HK-05]|nr:hypothetical protein NIES2130_30855 [Scytonema sp. HK-05]BAY44491.1 hypothetical protein SAMD00079811_20910 [Scytonema sp. HK-05]
MKAIKLSVLFIALMTGMLNVPEAQAQTQRQSLQQAQQKVQQRPQGRIRTPKPPGPGFTRPVTTMMQQLPEVLPKVKPSSIKVPVKGKNNKQVLKAPSTAE